MTIEKRLTADAARAQGREEIMTNTTRRNLSRTVSALLVLLTGAFLFRSANAQSPEVQQRVAQIKEASARNKQALAQYTWVEQVTISLKGEEKKQEHFQVRLGPDLKPQKTSLDPPNDASSSSQGGRLKRHVVAKKVAKKKEEYKEYADQMKALAQQYVPPDRDLLQQAASRGDITLGTTPGAGNNVQLVVHNYLKPNDSLTMVFDKTQKQLVSVQIASYMDDPKDAMNVTAQFSSLPDGTSHVSNVMVDGVSKKLNIAIQNSQYQHL
jgi:hypothetical protein